MAKYFLGSVGEAEAYEVTTKLSGATTMDLVFTSKTLTDSAVNISVNKEQIIDSYNGAPAGVFYHSPNVNITLSDILWNPKFVESSLGSHFNELCDNGNIEYYTIELTATPQGIAIIENTTGRTVKYPVPIDLPSITPNGENDRHPYVVIGKIIGDDEWYEFPYDPSSHKIGVDASIPDGRQGVLRPGAAYCFKYPIQSNRSKTLNITTKIIPNELFLVITTPVFMADSNDLNPMDVPEYTYISTGRMVGKIVYEVPRWVLDSDLSFNFTASGTAGMQLTGTVLESIDNEEESTFMRLREFIKPRSWYEGLVDLVPAAPLTNNTTPVVYGIYSDGSYSIITSSNETTEDIKLVFEPMVGALQNASGSTYEYDGHIYNVTGKFTGVIRGTKVKVMPAVVWLDDEEKEILVILDDIYCELTA